MNKKLGQYIKCFGFLLSETTEGYSVVHWNSYLWVTLTQTAFKTWIIFLRLFALQADDKQTKLNLLSI